MKRNILRFSDYTDFEDFRSKNNLTRMEGIKILEDELQRKKFKDWKSKESTDEIKGDNMSWDISLDKANITAWDMMEGKLMSIKLSGIQEPSRSKKDEPIDIFFIRIDSQEILTKVENFLKKESDRIVKERQENEKKELEKAKKELNGDKNGKNIEEETT